MKNTFSMISGLLIAVIALPVQSDDIGGDSPAKPQRVRVKDRVTSVAAESAPVAAAQPAETSDAGESTRDGAAAPADASDAAVDQALIVSNPGCEPPFKSEVAALFERWNAALRSGDPKKVIATYAPGSILLPTLSNRVRFTASEKLDYFTYFLKRHPEGRIDDRLIEVDCNSAVDSGIYTFRFGDGSQVRARYTFTYKRIDGDWLISSHHSSAMPERPVPAASRNTKPVAIGESSTTPYVRFP